MDEQKKIILFGAGLYGKAALDFYGTERVYCFADNFKAGQMFCGKNIIGFDELTRIHHAFTVAISMNPRTAEEVEKTCQECGIPVVLWWETVSLLDFDSRPEIAQFKDCHKGKRCFLIGNGPSLCVDDINRLHDKGEITFGCNEIREIYKHTPWRPSYYLVTDLPYLNYYLESIVENKASIMFLPALEKFYFQDVSTAKALLTSETSKTYYYNAIAPARASQKIHFSGDPSRGMYMGGSVIYCIMQLAAYMGFNELILLGVDNTSMNQGGQIHFYEAESVNLESIDLFTTGIEIAKPMLANAYKIAEKYSREHGFRIYNATRGGCLETFERVDFDSLFTGSSTTPAFQPTATP